MSVSKILSTFGSQLLNLVISTADTHSLFWFVGLKEDVTPVL